MTCEKLCKARLVWQGTPPQYLQTSHGFVANPLPTVIRAQLEFMGEDLRKKKQFLVFTRHLAGEIEVANPAIDRNGARPDNCEYPWESGAESLHSPLAWTFTPLQLLRQPYGPTFVKVLSRAIDRAIEEFR